MSGGGLRGGGRWMFGGVFVNFELKCYFYCTVDPIFNCRI